MGYMASVPTTKEFSKAILELSVALDPKLAKDAVQAHKKAVEAMGPNFITPLKNHEEVTTAKLIASAPPAAIQNVFNTVPQVQNLNGDWFAAMPVADAVKSYQAFLETAAAVKR